MSDESDSHASETSRGAENWQGLVRLPWFDDVLTMIRVNRFTNLVGEPSTGKTSFAFAAARKLTGKDPVVLAGSPETEMIHVFGMWGLVGNETRFLDGCLPLALKSNRWLLCEEFSLVPLDVRAVFLPLRGTQRITNPQNGEVLEIPSGFRLVATSNPENMRCSRFAGTAQALYDDFITCTVPPLKESQVRLFLRHNHPNASADNINRVMGLWNEYREVKASDSNSKASNFITYRAAAHLLLLLEAGMDPDVAVRAALVGKFITDPELHTAAELKADIS